MAKMGFRDRNSAFYDWKTAFYDSEKAELRGQKRHFLSLKMGNFRGKEGVFKPFSVVHLL